MLGGQDGPRALPAQASRPRGSTISVPGRGVVLLSPGLITVDVGLPQVVVYGLLRYPERPAHLHGRQRSGVDQAVDGHLRHSHRLGHFGDGEKPHLTEWRVLLSVHRPTLRAGPVYPADGIVVAEVTPGKERSPVWIETVVGKDGLPGRHDGAGQRVGRVVAGPPGVELGGAAVGHPGRRRVP